MDRSVGCTLSVMEMGDTEPGTVELLDFPAEFSSFLVEEKDFQHKRKSLEEVRAKDHLRSNTPLL